MKIDVLQLVIKDLMSIKGEQLSFLQIGAHDGKSLDPLHPYIDRHHWKGVLVEPQPNIFKRFVLNYEDNPNLEFENSAICDKTGKIKLYTFKDDQGLPDHATMLASLNRDALVNNGHGYKGEIQELLVHSTSLNDLFKMYKIEELDILQIDTEGYDFEILNMLETTAIRPTIINFEHGFYWDTELEKRYEVLYRMGYSIHTMDIDTVAYLQKTNYTRVEYT